MAKVELQIEFVNLRASGLSYEAIAQQLGVSKQTIVNWSKAMRSEIKNAQVIRTDALLKSFSLEHAARIERLCKMIKKLNDELDHRDFSELSTKDIIELASKLLTQLNTISKPLLFSEKTCISKPDFERIKEWEA